MTGVVLLQLTAGAVADKDTLTLIGYWNLLVTAAYVVFGIGVLLRKQWAWDWGLSLTVLNVISGVISLMGGELGQVLLLPIEVGIAVCLYVTSPRGGIDRKKYSGRVLTSSDRFPDSEEGEVAFDSAVYSSGDNGISSKTVFISILALLSLTVVGYFVVTYLLDHHEATDSNMAVDIKTANSPPPPPPIWSEELLFKPLDEAVGFLERKNLTQDDLGKAVFKSGKLLALVEYAPTGTGQTFGVYSSAPIPSDMSVAPNIEAFERAAEKNGFVQLEQGVKLYCDSGEAVCVVLEHQTTDPKTVTSVWFPMGGPK
jgi:hypothetical protein